MSIAIVSLLSTLLSTGSLIGPPDGSPAPPSHPRALEGSGAPPAPPATPVAPLALAAPTAPVAPAAPLSPDRAHSRFIARAPHPPSPPRPPRVVIAPEGSHAAAWSMAMGGPRLGTQVSTMTPALRDFFGAPEDAGLLVQGVEPDSAAQSAGVRVGDVIVEVDGQRIDQVTDVRRALAGHDPGDEVEIEVVRKRKRKTLGATMAGGSSETIVAPAEPPLPPEVRTQVERQLEEARRQLREVERQLEQLGRTPSSSTADDGKKTRRLRRKDSGKTKTKTKTKAKRKTKRKLGTEDAR